jgi:hypothetical protein
MWKKKELKERKQILIYWPTQRLDQIATEVWRCFKGAPRPGLPPERDFVHRIPLKVARNNANQFSTI